MGHAYANYFSKTYFVLQKNATKQKFHSFIFWQNPMQV